jgi:hypothetical protein
LARPAIAATPAEDLVRVDVVPPGDHRDRCTWEERSRHDLALQRSRRLTAELSNVEHLACSPHPRPQGRQIESRIDNERKNLKRGLDKDERLNFLSQAAKEFFYFKDGWRNYVSHNRVTYDEPEAFRTLEHSRAFIVRLATKLKESPYHYG